MNYHLDLDKMEIVKDVPELQRSPREELINLFERIQKLDPSEYAQFSWPNSADAQRFAARLRHIDWFYKKVKVMQRGDKVLLKMR